jgi:uncharacterized protein (DUF427 family)
MGPVIRRKPGRPGPGQESVWDYPRPPRIEPTARHLRIELGGDTVAETRNALRVLETSHPPTYFFPPGDVGVRVLRRTRASTVCEWKGRAVYFDVAGGARVAPGAAWSYPEPTDGAEALAGYVAFYAGPMDRCTVDGEVVTPQEGGFYGGWITSDLVGPFKGGAGTLGW